MESTAPAFIVEFPNHEIESKWEYQGSPAELSRSLFGEIAAGGWPGFTTADAKVDTWVGDISYWGRQSDIGLTQVCMSTPRDGQYLVVPKPSARLAFPASLERQVHPPLLRYEPRLDRLLSTAEFAQYVAGLVCVGTLTRHKYMFLIRSESDRIYNLVVDRSVFRGGAELQQLELEYKRRLGVSAPDTSGASILVDYERMHECLGRDGISPSMTTKFGWLCNLTNVKAML